MSEKKNRKYPEAFKLEALELLKHSQKSAAQIERELGITHGRLSHWRSQYQIKENGPAGPQLEPSELAAAQAEIRRLRGQLAEAELEREILKKTLGIFSRRSG
jgi:transposase